MAYMGQDRKKQIAEKLKIAMKGTGIKYTLGVHHHSTIVMRIHKGPVDFIQNHMETIATQPRYDMYNPNKTKSTHIDVNPYWYKEHFTGKALEILDKVLPILNEGNHNRSDAMSDYFDVGWYVSVKVGEWDKPYEVVA